MKKLISFLLFIATVLSFSACSFNNGIAEASTSTASTTSKHKIEDVFTFEKGDDGGYIVSSFSTNEQTPHEVEIPSEHETFAVTAIGKNVFSDIGTVSKIIIPDSIVRIEDGAFANCFSLKEIVMSKSIESIGKGAFKNCAVLETVELPWDILLGDGAFSECNSLNNKIYISQGNKVMNILMVGNSFCYYYPDELFGLAKEAGIEMNICNVYASGCTIESHYNWWQSGASNYEFYIYNEHGRRKLAPCNLEMCLGAFDWDVISIQDGQMPYRNGGVSGALASREPGLTELLKLFSERFPNADFYWHHTWSSQVGYSYKGYSILTKEAQDKEYRDFCTLTRTMVKKHGLEVIPSGEAWEIARANELIGDTLCMKDCHHEGESGGGQYLNACVWFEVLTGRSCIGNTFRPDYELDEEKIAVLQEAAHRAVLERKFNK